MKAVFLDRDGVICENRDDYVKSWDEFVWIPGAKQALSLLKERGYLIIVVTNQSAIGRGIISRQVVEEIHDKMSTEVLKMGGKIDGIYYCPHQPSHACNCRKPKPGLLLKAGQDFKLDFSSSYLVGDSLTDVKMGHQLGCVTIMVRTGKGSRQMRNLTGDESKPNYIAADLAEAANLIVRRNQPQCKKKTGSFQ